MKELTNLELRFNENELTLKFLNQFPSLINKSKKLRTLKIYGEFNDSDCILFLKQTIEMIKLNEN
jgi:hypothetical protein